jgi:hypothetical protein
LLGLALFAECGLFFDVFEFTPLIAPNVKLKSGMIDHIKCVVTLEGDLNDGRLPGIADKRPAHRTRKSEVDIREVEGG